MPDVVRFLFGAPEGLVDVVQVDVWESEVHRWDNQVTSHAVESGGDISSHVRRLPVTLELRGILSDSPPDILRSVQLRTGGRQTAAARFSDLLRIREADSPFEIATAYGVYSNMVVVSISAPRDAGTGNAIVFDAVFQEVRFAAAGSVEIPRDPAISGPSVDGGTRTPKPASAGSASQGRSVLSTVITGDVAQSAAEGAGSIGF